VFGEKFFDFFEKTHFFAQTADTLPFSYTFSIVLLK